MIRFKKRLNETKVDIKFFVKEKELLLSEAISGSEGEVITVQLNCRINLNMYDDKTESYMEKQISLQKCL